MKRFECEFESEVLAAALQGRWPDHVDPQLSAHVPQCAICSDVAAIAPAFDAAREESQAAAAIPDSGRMWWIAQLRAHREAAKTAGRPITAAQVIAFGCAIGLLGACFGATSKWFQSVVHDLLPAVSSLFAGQGLLLLAIGAILLLVVPAAVCVAMLRD